MSASQDESIFQGVREGVAYGIKYRFVFADGGTWHCYRNTGSGYIHAGLVYMPEASTLAELLDAWDDGGRV